ncbi:hypothetical protein JXA40_00500 [bacterium]|nr:hypothetical protein [candidate division CSSED10-310 bacterium]
MVFRSAKSIHKAFFTLFPALWFLAAASLSRHDIGVRHILPVYILVFMWLGGLPSLIPAARRSIFIGTVAVLSCIEIVRFHPDYIPYFNPLAGGKNYGYRYLSDSNLDWGQDLIQLRRYLAEKPSGATVRLDYFGDDDLVKHYSLPVAEVSIADEYKPAPGIYAVSIFKLQNIWSPSETRYAWLKMYEPEARIGGSIWIYRVDPHRDAPAPLVKQYRIEPDSEPLADGRLIRHLRTGWKPIPLPGDWLFNASDRNTGFRAVERNPEMLFAFAAPSRSFRLNADLFYLDCPGADHQTIRAMLNNTPIDQIVLTGGWENRSITLPSEEIGPGVNLLRFECSRFVFPDELCLPDYRIGSTGRFSPVDIFLRAGNEDDRRYRDMVVNGRAVETAVIEGYWIAVLDSGGNIVDSGSFEITSGGVPPGPVRAFLDKLQNETIILGIGARSPTEQPTPFYTGLFDAIGLSSDLNRSGVHSHVFIGVKGAEPESGLEKTGVKTVFLSVGSLQDHMPFAFAVNNVSFSPLPEQGDKLEKSP